jgi:hypothetical protein
MTKHGANTTVLAVATATVVVGSIYISYKQRRLSRTAARAAPPSGDDSPSSSEAERVAVGWVRPWIDDFRKTIHRLIGDLADVQKRVTGETEQVVARFKLGEDGRRLPDIDLTSQAPDPTTQPSPQSRP